MAPGEDSSGSETDSSQDEVSDQPNMPRADSTVEKAKAHRASFKPPRAWMISLGILLAACAGMVDVIAVRALGMFTTHATGTTARIGERLEGVRTGDMQAFSLQRAVLTVFSFMLGAYLCGLVIPRNQVHFGGKQFYGVALLGNSLLLVAATFVTRYSTGLAIYLSAVACGLQNAMCTLHLGTIIRTTHVTGTVTDVGSTLGRLSMLLLQKGCRPSRLRAFDRAEIAVDVQKLMILVPLWVGFLFGSYWGAFFYGAAELKEYAFLIPASITGLMAACYVCLGRFLKRKFQDFERGRLQEEVHQVLGRTKSHLESLHAGDGQPEETGSSMADLEADMDEMMAVMQEVEDTLDAMDEDRHRDPSRAASSRRMVMAQRR